MIFPTIPADAKALPSVGGNMGKYDLEKIASLKPDLVLAAEINTPEQVKALEDLNINVYYLANPTDLPGMYANLDTVGALTGHQPEAEKLVECLKTRVKTVEDKIAGVTSQAQGILRTGCHRPRQTLDDRPRHVYGPADQDGGWNQCRRQSEGRLGADQPGRAARAEPGLILLGDAAYGVTAEQIKQRPGWDKPSRR